MWQSSLLLLFLLSISFTLSIKIDQIEDEASWPPPDLTVYTEYGPVKGYTSEKADIWRAIPFAKPPVGSYRFRPPQVPDTWTEPIDGSGKTPLCPQLDLDNLKTVGQEDCLYLDIYRPAGATGPLPVMVWIFGGGYVVGDPLEFGSYDGTNRVGKHSVVLVNVNYRLNAFGFLALDELRNESGSGGSSGNYGVQDQRFALQWVQRNIKQFGGDPTKVTIYGESAGAFSVCYHIASPASKGLFRAAIMESGTCDSHEFFLDFKSADSWSADVAAWSGCNRTKQSHDDFMRCLRNTTAVKWMDTVLSWFTGSWDRSGTGFRPLLAPLMPWAIAIDGSPQGLQDVPLNLIKQGAGSQVPLIAGTNHDEGSIFVPAMPLIVPGVHFPFDEHDVNLTLLHFFANSVPTVNSIISQYPLNFYSDPSEQAAVILRDYFFVCATRRVLRAERDRSLGAWQYHFTYEYHHPFEYIELGDYHTSELKYVWDHVRSVVDYPNDSKMVTSFNYYWTNLATSLDPNTPGDKSQTVWTTYDSSHDNFINMTVPTSITANNYFTSACNFWDSLYPL